ncbi:MAG TPA: hypothetical protein H9881_16400 [Candidatus Stackebrandtia excrementipullorum]|nr:hypothetical protein [Candidatus Stackebrandtia excrementipullorum]
MFVQRGRRDTGAGGDAGEGDVSGLVEDVERDVDDRVRGQAYTWHGPSG